MKNFKILALTTILVLAAGLFAFAGNSSTTAITPISSGAYGYLNPNIQSPVIAVAKAVSPSVVRVVVHTTIVSNSNPFGQMSPFFKKFFGFNIPSPQQQEQVESLGSGIIFNSKGYVLTNYHVVAGAKVAEITLLNGKKYKGIVVGGDPTNDLAVIKIEAPAGVTFPAAVLGNSNDVHVGEYAIAIGNPFGLDYTVTQGIVSALNREVPKPNGNGYYYNMIQTSAAINPGNSGGPLVDIHGRVIGINTAIIKPSEGQGLGFAIPINTAKVLIARLIKGESSGFLGVEVRNLTPSLSKSLGIGNVKGALVIGVVPNSGAAKAGIKIKDVIVGLNGVKITSADKLVNVIHEYAPNNVVNVKVYRNGKYLTFRVKLSPKSIFKTTSTYTANGFTVAALTELNRSKYSIPSNVTGVVVTDVNPNSQAAMAGLQPGDVIMTLNNKRITSVKEFENLYTKIRKNGTVAMSVYSQGMEMLVIFYK